MVMTCKLLAVESKGLSSRHLLVKGARFWEKVGVGGVLMMSSRGPVSSVVGFGLAGRNCSIRATCSNRRTLGRIRRISPSLVVLSLVLPGVSNLRITHRIHGARSVPVVVIATGSTRVSGILNLRVNTSSCIAGPFSGHRLITHIGTGLEHRTTITGTAPRRRGSSSVRVNDLAVRPRTCIISGGNRGVRLARHRFRLLCCLTGRVNRIVAHRRLLRAI